MRRSGIIFVVLMAISEAMLLAQPQDWIPRGIDSLRHSASSKAEFTLDHSMLVFAAKMDPDNPGLQRVIAGMNGISVHSYHFSRTWTYDPAALSSVKDEYQTAGWKQLMNK